MSANKAALLNSATERAILEHDKALKGLKVKQYVSTEALRLGATAYENYDWWTATLAPGEILWATMGGILGADENLGIVFPFWNFYVDVDNDPDYIWFNGSQISTTGRRKVTYGWKYDQNDLNGIFSGKDGKLPLNFWLKNEDVDTHTYYVKVIWLTNFAVTDTAA